MDLGDRIGSEKRPLQSREIIKIAEIAAREVWGENGVIWAGGSFWLWDGGRWRDMDEEVVMRDLARWMEDLYVEVPRGRAMVVERVAPGRQMLQDCLQVMKSLRYARTEMVPVDGRDGSTPGNKVAVGDRLVTVTREGMEIEEVGRWWFDPGVLNAKWDETATCPTWERCVQEWGMEDGNWVELLQRWMGYCLVGGRDYQRWMLMEGRARAGKGVITRVLKGLLGRPAFLGTGVMDLAGGFGLDGAQWARVICVNECHEMKSSEGRQVASVIKQIVGADEQTINVKFQRQKRGVVLRAAVMVVANEVPAMPNKGDGMVGKMLVLPFRRSWVGREDLQLEEKLRLEWDGIVQWALKGYQRLVAAQVDARWPVPREAEGSAREYRMRGSPVAAFMEGRFVPMEGGFVRTQVILDEWADFVREHNIRGVEGGHLLLAQIKEECSWLVERARHPLTKARGLKGLALRTEREDHV